MDDSLATPLPLAALEMAITTTATTRAGLVHYSDRGVQYASVAYRQRLAQAGVILSMSRNRVTATTTSPWEASGAASNANWFIAASSPHEPKPRADVFEWIEVFYNRERFHRAIGYQSPVDFETKLN